MLFRVPQELLSQRPATTHPDYVRWTSMIDKAEQLMAVMLPEYAVYPAWSSVKPFGFQTFITWIAGQLREHPEIHPVHYRVIRRDKTNGFVPENLSVVAKSGWDRVSLEHRCEKRRKLPRPIVRLSSTAASTPSKPLPPPKIRDSANYKRWKTLIIRCAKYEADGGQPALAPEWQSDEPNAFSNFERWLTAYLRYHSEIDPLSYRLVRVSKQRPFGPSNCKLLNLHSSSTASVVRRTKDGRSFTTPIDEREPDLGDAEFDTLRQLEHLFTPTLGDIYPVVD